MNTANTRVFFCTRRLNPLSWLIRQVSGSPFSHCGLTYESEFYGVCLAVEAGLVGDVEVTAEPYLAKQQGLIELIPPADLDIAAGMRAVGKRLGNSYDYLSLFGRLWVFLGLWLGKKWGNPLGSPKADVCVELVDLFLMATYHGKSTPIITAINVKADWPGALYDRLISLGWKTA